MKLRDLLTGLLGGWIIAEALDGGDAESVAAQAADGEPPCADAEDIIGADEIAEPPIPFDRKA